MILDRFDFSYFPRLESERIVLREITKKDLKGIFNVFSSPEVTQHNDITTFNTPDEALWLVNFLRERFDERSGLRWGIALRGDESTVIGTCGFNTWERYNDSAVIGYDLSPAYWNRGLMTEAVQTMLRFGFEKMGLNRIEADVTLDNTASIRVLEKLGFQEEGVLRQSGYWKGQYHDLRSFSILRQDFVR